MSQISLITKIKKAGLLGRGCGTFPVAQKWELVKKAKSDTKYVIANCAESEPGIFKDKFILENYPEKVIDGIKLAMKTIGAKQGFIYLNPRFYNSLAHKLQILIGADNIEIFSNPTKGYIGGEESAIINLMLGKREEPRLKPPYITTVGLFDKPTLVNNCETFYSISLIANNLYKHERFFCISGDNTPNNVFSFPENITIKEALLKSGHYPDFPFFIQLGGGVAGVCLRANQIDDFIIKNYSGLVIHKSDKDEHKLILSWLEFFANESCGQCVPCREGTYRLLEMYKQTDYDARLFADIIYSMQNTTLCSLGKMAVTAITSYYANIKKQPLLNQSNVNNACHS